MLQKEEIFLRKTLIDNDCHEKFIDVRSRKRLTSNAVYEAPKKTVYLKLTFIGDQLLNDRRHKISSALSRTYFTSEASTSVLA